MNILSKPYIFVAMVLLVSSCKQDSIETNPPTASQTLVPLTIGNSWQFRYTRFNESGIVIRVDTVSFVISKDTLIQGEHWAYESYWQWSYRNDDLGLRVTNGDWTDLFAYPSKVGFKYIARTVMSTDTLVSTPLGVLHCYWYQTNWNGIPINGLFSPGFGFVRIEGAAYPTGGSPYFLEQYEILGVQLK